MVNFWKQSMYATKLRRFRLYGVPSGYYTKLGSVNQTSFAVCFMNCLLQALPFINWAYSGFRCMFWPLFKQCVLSKNVSLLHWRLYLPSTFFFCPLCLHLFSGILFWMSLQAQASDANVDQFPGHLCAWLFQPASYWQPNFGPFVREMV